MSNPVHLSKSEAAIVLGLKYRSYQEYLSARCLFHHGYIEQAVTISNTCIEKQLKAALTGLSVKFKYTHDTPQLLEDIRCVRPKLASCFNVEYFQMLKKVYNFRYFSAGIVGSNYSISRNYYLAELDFTFSILEPFSSIERLDGKVETSGYKSDIQTKLGALYSNNYILCDLPKESIFGGNDLVLAGIVTSDYKIYNAEISGPTHPFFAKLDAEGIKVIDNRFEATIPPDTEDTTYVRNLL